MSKPRPSTIDHENEEFDRLVSVTGVFLIPLSVLASALASAGENEDLKVGLSWLGLLISLVWLAAAASRTLRLPGTFMGYAVGWILPLLVVVG